MLNEIAVRSKITIVIDENLLMLKDALINYGFRVLTFPQGTKDEQIIPHLTGRAILTKNKKDFELEAVIHDFDIISIENIRFIDDKKDRTNETAKKIASAIRESKFYTLKGNYLLTVFDDGKYSISELH